MRTPFDLIDELLKYPNEVLEYALVTLMGQDKIDFHTVSNAYVRILNGKKKDLTNRLIEAETCVIESFHNRKTTDKTKHKGLDYTHTQRCLYLLNQSKHFNTDVLNEKYGYDEECGRKASWYELYGKELAEEETYKGL